MPTYDVTLREDFHRSKLVMPFGSFAPGETQRLVLSEDVVEGLEGDGLFSCEEVPPEETEPALPPSLRPRKKAEPAEEAGVGESAAAGDTGDDGSGDTGGDTGDDNGGDDGGDKQEE